MSTFFISDLHLHHSRPEITERFLNFLQEKAKAAKALYILGDFFEVWIGDFTQKKDPHDHNILSALKHYNALGTPVYFMHGNRDFLIEKQFAEATGCQLIPDPYPLSLDTKTVVLSHGDALCTLDSAYQTFRRCVRSPFIKHFFLSLPLILRKKIAGGIRAKSREGKNNYSEDPRYDVTQQAVLDLLQQHNAFTLIHGHTHKPGLHQFTLKQTPARRFVLGEWQKDECIIAQYDSGELSLINLCKSS